MDWLQFVQLKLNEEDFNQNILQEYETTEDVINILFQNTEIINKIKIWIEAYAGKEEIELKDAKMALKYKDEGNELFKKKNYEGALSFYTKSLKLAPLNEECLPLAFANRSAVWFRLLKYENVVNDVDLAIQHGYPINKIDKIKMRKAESLIMLSKLEEAKLILNELINSSDDLIKTKAMGLLLKKLEITNSESEEGKNLENLEDYLKGGVNDRLTMAAGIVDIVFDEKKGRHIVANSDINPGDVLFVEEPFSHVLLEQFQDTNCSYCCMDMSYAIPCFECCDVTYCSLSCKSSASNYHIYECRYLKLLNSIGLAHLGLRVLLQFGDFNSAKQMISTTEICPSNVSIYAKSDLASRYNQVYNLVNHLKKIPIEDLFLYSLTGIMLAIFLQTKTEYFNGCGEADLTLIASTILRHITQLICNASAVTGLESQSAHKVYGHSQERVATAIYPSSSMMNHSCDPDTISSFKGNIMVVRAIKKIPSGAEIFNCYGLHYARLCTIERQKALESQYKFNCECNRCQPSVFEFIDRFSALCCEQCKGPLVPSPTEMPLRTCADCKHWENVCQKLKLASKTEHLFLLAERYLEEDQLGEAHFTFLKCLKMGTNVLYKHHQLLMETLDNLARISAVKELYNESYSFLKLTIPGVEERFGSTSIELGNELLKLLDVLYCILQKLTPTHPKYKLTLGIFQSETKRAKEIFLIHYGTSHNAFLELCQKEQEIQYQDS